MIADTLCKHFFRKGVGGTFPQGGCCVGTSWYILTLTFPNFVGAALDYRDYQKDQMRALDTLAAHQVQLAHKESLRNDARKKELFQEVSMAVHVLLFY